MQFLLFQYMSEPNHFRLVQCFESSIFIQSLPRKGSKSMLEPLKLRGREPSLNSVQISSIDSQPCYMKWLTFCGTGAKTWSFLEFCSTIHCFYDVEIIKQ